LRLVDLVEGVIGVAHHRYGRGAVEALVAVRAALEDAVAVVVQRRWHVNITLDESPPLHGLGIGDLGEIDGPRLGPRVGASGGDVFVVEIADAVAQLVDQDAARPAMLNRILMMKKHPLKA